MSGKTLLFLRHAKSSWKQAELSDHERPLKRRGQDAAVRMGRLISEETLLPQLVLCSTACRARETAGLVLGQLSAPVTLKYLDNLYHAEPDQIMAVLANIEEPADCVLVIGHNPGMEEFCSRLTERSVVMPTAALAWIHLEITDWSEFSPATRGTLQQLWCPRELDCD